MSSPDKALKDDSAKGADPEKGGKYGSGTSTGSSARGSAEFLSDVEGKRAIKVCLHTQELSPFATLQSFGQWRGLLMRTSDAMHWCLCVRLHMRSCH